MKNKSTVFASIPSYEGAAVYSITDNEGRRYIGSTCNLQRRISDWNVNFKTMKRTGEPVLGCTKSLADAIYAGKEFSISVVQELDNECSRDDRRKAEQEAIEKCGGIENTYNHVNAMIPSDAPVTEKRKQSMMKYWRENVKRVPLDMSHEMYDNIKAHADRAGMPVNRYLKTAAEEKMARDDASQADSE